jgi:hypothetical protein
MQTDIRQWCKGDGACMCVQASSDRPMREIHLPVARMLQTNTIHQISSDDFGSTAGCLMLTDSLRRRGDLKRGSRPTTRTEAAARYLKASRQLGAGRLSSLGETTAADVRLTAKAATRRSAAVSSELEATGCFCISIIGDKRRRKSRLGIDLETSIMSTRATR